MRIVDVQCKDLNLVTWSTSARLVCFYGIPGMGICKTSGAAFDLTTGTATWDEEETIPYLN